MRAMPREGGKIDEVVESLDGLVEEANR